VNSKLLYSVYTVVTTVLLVGCGSVQVKTYSVSPVYYTKCMAPNAMYRSTDRECRHMNEPKAEFYAVKEVNQNQNWSNDTAVLIWCRQDIGARRNLRECRGIPEK